jgi:hypothetical protein
MTPGDDFSDVPERYRGVWRRTLLETPDVRDTTTWVHWLQTARWHADLRVPAAADVDRCAIALDGMTPSQHLALAHQQGFFGRTEIRSRAHGDVCTWHRRLDVQPPGLTPDVGWMEFSSDDRVIETGVHGAYREVWERVPGSIGRCAVLANTPAPSTDDAEAIARPVTFLLLCGTWLMRVRARRIGWPADTAPGDTLATLLSRHPDASRSLLDFEISWGPWNAGRWSIERSTLPEREGRTESLGGCRLDNSHAQITDPTGTSTWRVLEWNGDARMC